MDLKLDVKCRICRKLSKKGVTKLNDRTPGRRETYAEMFKEIATIPYNVMKCGPQFLCRICTVDLCVAFDFRKKCIKSENLFIRQSASITGSGFVQKEPEQASVPDKTAEKRIESVTDEENESPAEDKNESSSDEDNEPLRKKKTETATEDKNKLEPSINPVPQTFVAVPESATEANIGSATQEKNNGDASKNPIEQNFVAVPQIKSENNFIDETMEFMEDDYSGDDGSISYQSSSNAVDIHNCPHCPEEFTTISGIIDHLFQVHDGKKLECDKPGCTYTCELDFQMIMHNTRSHKKNENTCLDCKTTFETEDAYYIHMRDVHEFKGLKCKKRSCKFRYFTKEEYKQHNEFEDHSNPAKKFKCEYCDMIFKKVSDVTKHREKVHIEQNPPEVLCPYCGKSVKAKNMVTHIRLQHEQPAPYFVCDICGGHYTNKQFILQHMRFQHMTNYKKYQCGHCTESFKNGALRMFHEFKVHKITKHICQHCGYASFTAANLREHIAGRHNPERNFPCPIERCNKKFVTKKRLKDHMKYHDEARPFHCDVCGERFKFKCHVSTHVKEKHL